MALFRWLPQPQQPVVNKDYELRLKNLNIKQEELENEVNNVIKELNLLRQQIVGVTPNPTPQVKAFPTAEGYGKDADAGRAGTVIKVTNLNGFGAGSFREAVNASGNRTIVFEVGGTIDLGGDLDVLNPGCRIAGQTAPGGGIAITGGMFHIRTSNVIVQHLRFRGNPVTLPTKDSLQITAFAGETIENVVIDHCTMSWAGDENLNIRGVSTGIVRNVTVQNCIISEAVYGCLIASDAIGSVDNITFYKNLFAHNQERVIRGSTNNNNPFIFEMVNNIIYGAVWQTTIGLGTNFSLANNIYKESSETVRSGAALDGTTSGQINPAETYAYVNGNLLIPGSMPLNNATIAPYLEATPFVPLTMTPTNTASLEAVLLNDVGVTVPTRDTVDARIIQQYNDGDGALAFSGTNPTLANGTPPTDSNNDGIPDAWTTANMPPGALATDIAPSGYTWLEEYINNLT